VNLVAEDKRDVCHCQTRETEMKSLVLRERVKRRDSSAPFPILSFRQELLTIVCMRKARI
jgi:hypothetical protein